MEQQPDPRSAAPGAADEQGVLFSTQALRSADAYKEREVMSRSLGGLNSWDPPLDRRAGSGPVSVYFEQPDILQGTLCTWVLLLASQG